MKYSVNYENAPKQPDIEALSRGIALNAKQKRGLEYPVPFAFFIRDENNEIKGGCNGNIGYDWLYVDQLWVDESLRGKGHGRELMQAAEKLAVDKKCISVAVNTADWEALDFYKKLGFRVEFARHGLAKNSIFYFLRKDLLKNEKTTIKNKDGIDITVGSTEDNEFLYQKINEFNNQKVPFTQKQAQLNISYTLKDKENTIIGGIKSILYCWGCLYIDVLWINEKYRRNHLGSMLLNKVETEAKKIGCTLVHVDTFDFQAKGFYIKNGYELFGELDNCPPGHKRLYLKKGM